MSDLRLYYSPGACSLVAHIALEEMGVPYESARIIVADGENQRPEYRAINPRGRVPALLIREASGDQVLTELLAIIVFLHQRCPQAQLLPEGGLPLARALEWFSWLGSTVHQTGSRMVLRPERFTTGTTHLEAIAERGRENVESAFVDIEQRLQGMTWALGARYSMVDAFLLVFFRWGNRIGFHMRDRFPRLSCLADAVSARPAVRRIVEREGIRLE